MNLIRAAFLVWRSKSNHVEPYTYGAFTQDESTFLASVSRMQACDVELRLLTRKLPILEANFRRAQAELAECQAKIERARNERNLILGTTERKHLPEAKCHN